MTVRAKMKCWENHPSPSGDSERTAFVRLSAVVDDSPENKSWSKWTPNGEVTLSITNPDAIDAFVPGKTYFVDFTPAD